MGLFKYLHRKRKHESRSRHLNPFADDTSRSRESSSHSADPSSRHSSAASNSSGTAKHRSSVDEFVDVERKRLVEAFRIIDKDGDGKISKQELSMMWQRLGEKISEEELKYMIRDADGDGDGKINFDEFIALQKIMGVEDQEEHSREIRLAFNVVDVDKSGRISAKELQEVMKELGQMKITVEECAAMLDLVDDDGDGMISFEEFERLMTTDTFKTID